MASLPRMPLMRRSLRVISIGSALVAVLISGADAGQIPTRAELYSYGLTNGVRMKVDRRVLRRDDVLASCARRHAHRMAAEGDIWHSDGCPGARTEVVGMGPSVATIMRAMLRSDPHRKALLCRGCRYAGAGIVYDNGTYYLVHTYR